MAGWLTAQPLVVTLALAFWILDNRVSVFDADGIIEPPHSLGTAPKVSELSGVVQGGRVPNDVIMDVGFVNMGTDNKSVIALGETAGQLIAQAVGFFRRDLAGDEGLPYLVGDHIISPAPSAGLGEVLPLGE